MWVVKLIKNTPGNIFGQEYFPRKFRYKKEAEALKKNIEEWGGKATVTKEEHSK